jgi:hypothetical protein
MLPKGRADRGRGQSRPDVQAGAVRYSQQAYKHRAATLGQAAWTTSVVSHSGVRLLAGVCFTVSSGQAYWKRRSTADCCRFVRGAPGIVVLALSLPNHCVVAWAWLKRIARLRRTRHGERESPLRDALNPWETSTGRAAVSPPLPVLPGSIRVADGAGRDQPIRRPVKAHAVVLITIPQCGPPAGLTLHIADGAGWSRQHRDDCRLETLRHAIGRHDWSIPLL